MLRNRDGSGNGGNDMTAQFAERLRYHGHDVAMYTNPLSDYFAMGGFNPGFARDCTAMWRGYVGSWEIVDDRLYLIGLDGTLKDGTEASLASIFAGVPDRVFAHWYSRTIRIPQGRQLEYVHMDYGSTFERELLLDIERGVVVSTRVADNDSAESDGT